MRPVTASSRSSACSWVSLSFFTSAPSWRSVTSCAFAMPASTNFCSTSFRTTGMSAFAIAWAISPPMVPAPTTAALNTNKLASESRVADAGGYMAQTGPGDRRSGLEPVRGALHDLGGERGERSLEREAHLRAHEQGVGDLHERPALPQVIGQLLAHDRSALRGCEAHRELALGLWIGETDAMSLGLAVLQHPLGHLAATGAAGAPSKRPIDLGISIDAEDDAELVDPRRP